MNNKSNKSSAKRKHDNQETRNCRTCKSYREELLLVHLAFTVSTRSWKTQRVTGSWSCWAQILWSSTTNTNWILNPSLMDGLMRTIQEAPEGQNSSELKFIPLSTYRENNCPSVTLKATTKSLTKTFAFCAKMCSVSTASKRGSSTHIPSKQ
jgi:hypothetical protein